MRHHPTTAPLAVVGLLVGALALTGCPPTPPGGGRLIGPDKEKPCEMQRDELRQASAGVSANFDDALTSMGGEANLSELKNVKTNFDSIQRDYELKSYRLCQDFEAGRLTQQDYARTRDCLDEIMTAMRMMEAELKQSATRSSAKQVSWSMEGKMSWIQDAAQCKVTRTQVGAPIAAPEAKPADATEVAMTAYLLCQRQTSPGAFEDVPDCDAAELTEGDRVRIGAKVDTNAFLYIVNYNDKGQFQMLYPPPGDPNVFTGGQEFFLPEGEGADAWLVLDDVADVVEHLQLVASAKKIPELEARRGMNLPPTSKGKLQSEAVATRGLLEPYTHRGFSMPKSNKTRVKVSGQTVETVPVEVKGLGATVVEFEVIHK